MLAVVSIILGTSQLTTAVYAQSPPQPKMFPLVIPDLWQAVYGQEESQLLEGPTLYEDIHNGFRVYVPENWLIEELIAVQMGADALPDDTSREVVLQAEDEAAEERGYDYLIEICHEDDMVPDTLTRDDPDDLTCAPGAGLMRVQKVLHLQDKSLLSGVVSGEDIALETVIREEMGNELIDFIREQNQTMIALYDLAFYEVANIFAAENIEVLNDTITTTNLVDSTTNETVSQVPVMLREMRYSDILSGALDAEYLAAATLLTVREDIIDEETGEVDYTGYIAKITVPSYDRETLGRPDILFKLPDQKQMFETFELVTTTTAPTTTLP